MDVMHGRALRYCTGEQQGCQGKYSVACENGDE